MIKTYYRLTKPGIIYGNALAAVAGFFFASRGGPINWWLFVATVLGLSLIIASACVLNNYMDRDIDARMERTKNRAMVRGAISDRNALIFAAVLGVMGVVLLAFYSSYTALAAALVAFVVYVALYTPLKPRTPMALFVGAVSGAMPPVVGYTAVTNMLDWYAFALFLALFLWQIPHFLAIATYRYNEYAAAGVPLFIKKEPSDTTKRRAKVIFYCSLVVLLVACGALLLAGLFV